jgi:hypothetical protein
VNIFTLVKFEFFFAFYHAHVDLISISIECLLMLRGQRLFIVK